MRIALKDIKGLDRRVRQQMSPEKLEELTDSIKDLGLIVPIKVRKNGAGYVLIYGHRRVMAAKAAGLTEIEAIVEPLDDEAALLQSGIENKVREDMSSRDFAKLLRLQIDTYGYTPAQAGSKYGIDASTVGNYLSMLDPELGLVDKSARADLGVHHVQEAKAGTGDSKLAAQVLKKAADEELSTRDTRKVAEVVRQANEFGGAAAVKRVLAQPAARIIDTAAYLPARPKVKTATLAPSKSLFQWMKDPQTLLAEDAFGAIDTVVALMAKGDRDPAGAKVALLRFLKLAERLVRSIEAALDRLS